MSSAKETRDHKTIKQWVEKHEGVPAVVDQEGDNDYVLRIKFTEESDNLKEISWDEFFQIFDERELTFLYQDDKKSRFNKFVREEESEPSGSRSSKK